MAGGVENELRLFGARDDFDLEAGLAPDARNEGFAVLRLTHGAGRDRANPIDPPHLGQVREILERAHRQLHRLARQLAAGERVASQPHHLLDAVDDLEVPVTPYVRDHHVNRVRTDVDRGQTHD